MRTIFIQYYQRTKRKNELSIMSTNKLLSISFYSRFSLHEVVADLLDTLYLASSMKIAIRLSVFRKPSFPNRPQSSGFWNELMSLACDLQRLR